MCLYFSMERNKVNKYRDIEMGKQLSKGKKTVREGRNVDDQFMCRAEKERELIRSLIFPLFEFLRGFARE